MNHPGTPEAVFIFTAFRRGCQEFASGLLPNPMQGIDLHRIKMTVKPLKYKGKNWLREGDTGLNQAENLVIN